MDRFERLSIEWLRALRGRRSQRAFSRLLGYRTNIAYRWESGRCWPTARTVLTSMQRLGYDVPAALTRFYGVRPAWLASVDLTSRVGIVRLLEDLRGQTPIVSLSAACGFSRHRLARWISGDTEPRLPEWLALIEAASLRLLDFVTAFFEPSQLPSIEADWKRLRAVREAAYSRPESHIVLRVLELASYRALTCHDDGFIARRLRMRVSDVVESIALLEAAGQVRRVGKKWIPVDEAIVDTRQDPERARQIKAWWLEQASQRARAGQEGVFGYNLFSVSNRDFEKLRELHGRYYRDMQELISKSKPNERVVLFATQLFHLDEP